MSPTDIALIIALILVVVFMIYDTYKRKPKKTTQIVRESLRCVKCGLVVEKDFEPGDFIGLIKGKCPTCGGDLKIKAIYAIEKK